VDTNDAWRSGFDSSDQPEIFEIPTHLSSFSNWQESNKPLPSIMRCSNSPIIMKKHLAPSVAILLLLASSGFAAEPAITIGKYTFNLAYAPKDSPVGLREYVLPGETVDNWTRMASVRVFKGLKNPKELLDRIGEQVMDGHPAAKAMLVKNEKTGEEILDFLTFSADSRIAEWNLMRAKYDDAAEGLVVYQYAARFPGTEKSKDAILAERTAMLKPFGEASFREKTDSASKSPAKK